MDSIRWMFTRDAFDRNENALRVSACDGVWDVFNIAKVIVKIKKTNLNIFIKTVCKMTRYYVAFHVCWPIAWLVSGSRVDSFNRLSQLVPIVMKINLIDLCWPVNAIDYYWQSRKKCHWHWCQRVSCQWIVSIECNVVYLRCSAKNDLFPIRKKHIMVILHFLASFSHIRSPFFPNFQHIFIQIHWLIGLT